MNLKLVIVLGNKLLSPQIHQELKGRMDIGIKVLKKKPADYLILSGGKSNPQVKYAECEIMRDYAIESGISIEKIMLDYDALDTIGNAYFTRKLLDRLENDSIIIYVVSSCYHMERVKFIFEMCYKNRYNLNFDYCYPSKNAETHKKEERSIESSKIFFYNLVPGDVKEIEKRLFTLHKLYQREASAFAEKIPNNTHNHII